MSEQLSAATAEAERPPYPALGVAAKAIIVNADGAILVIKRSPTSHFCPSLWDLPGGKMGSHEQLVEAMVREVYEETGLTVQADAAVPFHVSHFVKEPFWVTCVTFACPGFEGDVRLSSEHTDHAWVGPDALDTLDYAEAIKEQLDAYVSR